MHLRLLAFLPVAALITFGLFGSASSLVSALESSLIDEPEARPTPWMRLVRFETECDVLIREIHALSHEVTACEADPACVGSPLLCPVVMDKEIDREYRRLRGALNEQCGLSLALMDYVWAGPDGSDVVRGDRVSEGSLRVLTEHDVPRASCGTSHDWLEAKANGMMDAERFLF